MAGRILLILKELAGSRFITFIVFSVTALSACAALSFSVISDNFDSYITRNFAASLPPDTIVVSPKQTRGMFIFSGKTGRITEGTLRKIRKLEGVKNAEPVLAVNVPCQGRISFFTFSYSTDLVCAGVPYRTVKRDLKTGRDRKQWLKHNPASEIPVLVPRMLIDSYNSGLAGANGLPPLSPRGLKGLNLELLIGHSSLTSLEGAFRTRGIVAGTTDALSLMGLIIPEKSAAYINRHFGKKTSYMSLNVKVKGHGHTEAVKRRIRRMGLRASTGTDLSKEILKLKKTVKSFIYSMTSLVSLLAVICISFCCAGAVWSRMEYYRILRMLGATKLFIGFTIIFRFALTGFAGGVCALYLFRALSPAAAENLRIPGMALNPAVSPDTALQIMTAAALFPALSCLPAVVRMFTAKLNRN